MKAIILHDFGGPGNLKYEEVDDPHPGEGEVLVRLAATSVNPVDYKQRSGSIQARMPIELPAILGRDISGIVRALGPGVTGIEEGDRVMALGQHTYAELVVVKASDLTLVPPDLNLVEAAALPLITLTGQQLIARGTKVEKGQTILVTGALGAVGRSAVWTARKAGATVLAGVRSKQRKEAEELHADEILSLDDDLDLDKLGALDAIADTVGGETAERLMAKVKQGGVFASVLGPPANARMHPTVRVEAIQAVPDPAMLRTMADDVVSKRFGIPIDRMVPLAQAAEAHAAAEKGGLGKILLLA